jgi:hypothetical protein
MYILEYKLFKIQFGVFIYYFFQRIPKDEELFLITVTVIPIFGMLLSFVLGYFFL